MMETRSITNRCSGELKAISLMLRPQIAAELSLQRQRTVDGVNRIRKFYAAHCGAGFDF